MRSLSFKSPRRFSESIRVRDTQSGCSLSEIQKSAEEEIMNYAKTVSPGGRACDFSRSNLTRRSRLTVFGEKRRGGDFELRRDVLVPLAVSPLAFRGLHFVSSSLRASRLIQISSFAVYLSLPFEEKRRGGDFEPREDDLLARLAVSPLTFRGLHFVPSSLRSKLRLLSFKSHASLTPHSVRREAPRRRFELLSPYGDLLSKQAPWPG